MAQLAPAPDFRFVGVEPGPSARAARIIPLAAGAVTFAIALGLSGFELSTLPLALLLGFGTKLIVQRMIGPASNGDRQSRMSIVPWGVLVHNDETPRVLRWPGVRSVEVELVHEMDNATPSIRWSVVKIRTEHELLAGRAPGGVCLESLEANLERYANEAARPLAADLKGESALDEWPEPTFERLLEEARRVLASGELGAEFLLSPSSYRRADVETCPESRTALGFVLSSSGDSPADPRPLALILSAELGARELGPLVMLLTTSPNPMVAAIARAAALRLGVELSRAGALDELAEFVPSGDLAQIRVWAAGS